MALELKIKEFTIPAPIVFNYDELRQEIEERAEHYASMIYDDTQIKDAKADRARLNKLKKTLNDERIKREREYNEPFQMFKTQIAEIIGIIDKPIATIDAQIKAFEADQKERKRAEIMEFLAPFELPFEIPVERIFNEKWLNASATNDQITTEISEALDRIQTEAEILEGLAEYQTEAILTYKDTLDIRAALKAVDKAKAEQEEKARIAAHIAEQKAKLTAPTEPPKAEQEKPQEMETQWVRFEALLNMEQAAKLRTFCKANNILIRRA